MYFSSCRNHLTEMGGKIGQYQNPGPVHLEVDRTASPGRVQGW